MSTSPSVIRRFVEYYAGLDAQPPAALAALYHPDAERSFWSASGAVRHSALLYPSAGQRGAVPVHHRHAALRRPAVRRDLDHALVASAHCRRRNPGPAGLLGGGHRRGAVLHQRDYYDAGEMIYEHLPLLGWAVRGVKRRVRS